MPRCNTESELLKFPRHSGVEPLKLLLDKTRTRRNFNLKIEEEISPINLLLDARIKTSRTLLKLDEGKELRRPSLSDRESVSMFGRRKMSLGNFPCNPQPPRKRDDKEEDRFDKELGATKDIFTESKASSLSLVRIELVKIVRPKLQVPEVPNNLVKRNWFQTCIAVPREIKRNQFGEVRDFQQNLTYKTRRSYVKMCEIGELAKLRRNMGGAEMIEREVELPKMMKREERIIGMEAAMKHAAREVQSND
ncbi:hypothetical protein SADUNF_Sadunf12G0038200 [Salix dunnii]|uniref:Uncharacterized protein n=1 Tax=Salix dunnii TaxID=1413687 RepID=A0A835JL02_9ROSI|nr:hypothetical protein SADUNF_Sadunf12G0038200 [Salix dunnii]